MSTRKRCSVSIAAPSIFGGASTTVGPSPFRSRKPIPYTVSVFAVSTSVSASMSVSQMTTWLERLAPKSRMPRRDSMMATAGIWVR